MPTHPTTPTSTQPRPEHAADDDADLADLDALTKELNRLNLPSLRLTPPGKNPYVDTGLPQGMAPGVRIHIQAGTFFWPGARPIAPSDRPTEAATIIARELRSSPATPTPTP